MFNKFRALPKRYCQKADGISLLFELTKEESYKNIMDERYKWKYWSGK